MKNDSRAKERNCEIVTFFYMIMTHRIRQGMSPEEARHEAYDAVSLRYEISRGRLLNIISEQKTSQKVNILTLRKNAVDLIGQLEIVNNGLGAAMSKNERLISILKECVEDDS